MRYFETQQQEAAYVLARLEAASWLLNDLSVCGGGEIPKTITEAVQATRRALIAVSMRIHDLDKARKDKNLF